MKVFKKIIVAALFLNSTILCSQSLKEKIADKKFDNFEYASATPFYEELSAGKNAILKYHVRAAECHMHSNNYQKSQMYYDKAFASSGMSDSDLYNYYQVLKYNSEYDKAQEVFSKINNTQYKLIRENLAKKKYYAKELMKDSGNYTLKQLPTGSEENDFCPYVFNNEMFFLSSRRNTSLKSKKFAWDNSYFLDVYKAKVNGSTIEKVTRVEDLKTTVHEGPLCFTKDGNTQFITRNNQASKSGKINLKIYIRKKENDKWGEWMDFVYNNNDYSCGHPAVSADGKTLYFVSDMPGTFGLTDVWMCALENNNWSKPKNLGPSVNSEGREMFPFLFEDEVLFYSSDGKVGLGGLDIFYTVAEQDNYFEAQNLGYPLNSHFDDFGFFATSTTEGFISSNRETENDRIYSFTAKHSLMNNSLDLIVKDKDSKEVLPNTHVALLDDADKLVNEGNSNANGEIKFYNLNATKNYKVKVVKDEYRESIEVFKSEDVAKLAGLKHDMLIEKTFYGLTGIVTDAETSAPIENAKITITDGFNQKDVLNFNTTSLGDFKHPYKDKKIGSTMSYIVKIEKVGYITKTQAVEITIKKDGYIVLQDLLNTKMYKIKLGADLGKMVDLKPIYFDLGKSTIREDAALELDKIVTLMKENPSMVIELGSHTDCRGTAKSNMTLSDQRAKSSATYIMSKGFDKSHISGKGFGESKLINNCKCEGKVISNCSEDEHAQNRRTEFKIVKIKE